MKRWLVLQNWHIVTLLGGLGLSAALFAWATVNLYNTANENLHFIAKFGLMGLFDGGLLQFLEVCLNALAALFLFLLFKGCETEIMQRWRGLDKRDPGEV